jgi:ribosomal-protein-alanine N-acetyltransferase
MPLRRTFRIDTPRLALVPVTGEHLPDLFEMNRDDQVTAFVPYPTWTSLDDGVAWLARVSAHVESGTAEQLVLQRKPDGKVIGTLLLFKHDEGSRRIELGYALARACWGQGFMREAVQAACEHAFSVLDIRRIEAEVNPANTASCRVLANAGFHLEGRLRQRWTSKGVTYDTNLYGLLLGDWKRGA